ncbi:MAG: radical SAM protein [Clostridia bacterium]|nr:radical SAM protein [Clostridia bacterium]
MKIENRAQVLEILQMPMETFLRDVVPEARKAFTDQLDGKLRVTSMMGFSNICKNRCLYCGMRAGSTGPERYRIPPEDVIAAGNTAADAGFGRIFLISGEDPGYGFNQLLRITSALKARGMFISLACGEWDAAQYRELCAAGADEYVIKFEMSHPDSFDRLNPSTDFDRRMRSIRAVQDSGMLLASGNIVDWPGQTTDELADDIMLMKSLGISWAPVIPYLPARGTPLAEEGGPGSRLLMLREIAILRLMIPGVHITAQQPGEDLSKGLSDPEGNAAAVNAGADVLFWDLLSDPQARSFRVIDVRNLTDRGHISRVAEMTGRAIDTGEYFHEHE